MNYQSIHNIATICNAHGVKDAVLSPGSRNAPLTYAFVRNKNIKTYTISDERSAAFIALGISQKSKKPVVISCTSGSAPYNYAPAVAEAFYQNIPLIIITADRPPEWIDQLDGQTIRQENIYGGHVKKSFNCPVDTTNEDASWHFDRIINEAMILATNGVPGPVHINIPFREPFYPTATESDNTKPPKIIQKLQSSKSVSNIDWVGLVEDWRNSKKKLILAGQDHLSHSEVEALGEFAAQKDIPIIGDVLSNMHCIQNNITLADSFIGVQPDDVKEQLRPDLLITFGKSTISKNLKLYLRAYQPKIHWHIQENGYVPDTYKSLTKIIPTTIYELSRSIAEIAAKADHDYIAQWANLQTKTRDFVANFAQRQNFNEFTASYAIFENLPLACDIHLANSMPVRWANIYGLDHTRQQVEIFSNRGTSGIDGCTSTAIGSALESDKTTLLITGDMAFFYDRNAFWNKYIPDNLRVIVLNNHGGGIFDIINGPSDQPEHEEYFLTEQNLSARALATEFGLKYYHCGSLDGLSKGLDKFWVRDGTAKILEIETDIKSNTSLIKSLKKEISELWN